MTDRTSDEEDPNEARSGEQLGTDEHDVIRKDIMPILGLQISTDPYPFLSKTHMDKIRHDIGAALPSDKEILK
jgi:hypothetical protein